MQIATTFQPKTKADWRDWLSKNHTTKNEIWVILYKKATGKQTVTLPDLIDEALCFGWIDNLEKGIDEQTYAIRFTPRKSKSNWSQINTKRYYELLKQGLVVESGRLAFENR